MVTSYDSPTEPRDRPAASVPYAADGRKRFKRARPGEIDFASLFEAMRYNRKVMERFRTERTRAVREFVGYHYSQGGSPEKVPVNLLARYVQVVSRSLVPKTPRVMLSTRRREVQPAVAAMQDWQNRRLEEMHFAETIRRWVIDSMFCVGVMKVALATPSDAALGGYVSPAGVPFAETVDPDDFTFDSGARDFRKVGWVGHRYCIPREVAESLDYFEKAGKRFLDGAVVASERKYNEEGDERIHVVGEGYEGGANRDWKEMVDLWEIYLPQEKRVCTFASDSGRVPVGDCKPLRVQEWVGPDCGPYHYLALMPVPGNAMPKAPVHDLIDLHRFVNALYRKLIAQAMRQKTNLPVRGGQLDDAKNLKEAPDGEMFICENADAMKEVSWGGPNPVNAQYTIHLSDVFNEQAGNLKIMSGAAPQSKTATQDRILNENASAGVADMQEHTITGISKVCDALNWFWWYHPQQVMSTTKSLPGAEDISIRRDLYPAGVNKPDGSAPGLVRQGRYEDIACRVDPYSLVYRTPLQRLQFLSQLVKDTLPMMPLLAPQGIQFDAMAYFKMVSEYADEPDVAKLFTIAEPVQQPPGSGGPDGPGMPTQTSREYVRRSIGQDTEANRAAEMDKASANWGAENMQ